MTVSAHTGKERLAACLGVTVQEAARFLESFLQKYKKIKDFAQATIARCHQTGEPAAATASGWPLSLSHAWPAAAGRSPGPCSSGGWVDRWEGSELKGGAKLMEAGYWVAGNWVSVQPLLDKWDQKPPHEKGPEPASA